MAKYTLYQHQLARFATLAQLAEQCFRKAKVPGSNPGGGSILTSSNLFAKLLIQYIFPQTAGSIKYWRKSCRGTKL